MFQKNSITAEEKAFQCLFEAYKERLYNYTFAITHSHYTAEEIVQEIFLKLWIHRHEWADIRNPEAYIFTIARNKVFNHLRKARYDEKLVNEMKAQMVTSSNNVEEYISLEESRRLLQKAINHLSPQRQLVYRLSRYRGLNFEQIAQQLQLSRNTVKNHLVHALRFIRKYLDKNTIFIVILSTLAIFFFSY